ncbi:hypothetical protein Sango_2889600 [Sesamum angolense]|uniref:Reverse transcriptase domain-containing protein n=1 Tax=Sesamum angolense TaxID=2727404 RepID=A0AAE1T613_9LAMI|nr:hypothetical protein Sango_2889600 [Sesamum angolense]
MQVSLFRFDNYLALSPGFLASVHFIWRHPVVGTPIYSVTRKLKALKPIFRQQRRCKGDLVMNVKLADGFLEVAQNILQFDRHNSLLLLLEHSCRLVYLKASKLEQVMLRQIAKLQWLKGGDQCSKIFFRRVATRRANKRVFQIFDDDGNEETDPTVISSIFVDFFQGFLGVIGLIGPLTFSIYAPGLGIFSRMMRLGLLFVLLPLMKLKHLSLILRKTKPLGQMDSPQAHILLECYYKVITKILVSRIRENLDLLISLSQYAFVPGRLISDNVLLAQELFSGYNQCRLPPRCALNVDLRKAYATVEWDFLITTLRMFGFPAVFIRWIEECVTSAHYSVVVNGGQLTEQDGEFRYHWRCQELNLFQLSFADDLLLLCKADVRSVNLFCPGLDLLATLSSLHTNPQKSQLIISKAALGIRDSLLATLGFQEGHLLVRYLGLPLISARLSFADCQPLLQKIDSRIKGWEGVQLSFAGRVQLIKSVLISFEVY